jgi:hypothetical protein
MTRSRTGGEKEILSTFLDQQRDVVLWKLDGLTDDQLRQPITPGGLYLLGLVKHLAELEPGDTTESVLGYYARACSASDQAISEVDFDTTGTTWLGDTVSFRWAILHMIEETARHAGHADVIREHIDNTTGHLPHVCRGVLCDGREHGAADLA